MAESPAQKLAAVLTEALNKWVKDNPDINAFAKPEKEPTEPTSGTSTSTDLIGTLLGVLGFSLLANPELGVFAEGLKEVEKTGGENGTWFGSGWFVGEQLVAFAEPLTRMFTHMIEDLFTSQILDPDVAADFVARGIISQQFGESEASGGGFDTSHFNWMLEAAYNYPSLAESLSLWNRGQLSEADVNRILTLNAVAPQYQSQLKSLQREILSPADWGLAALRKNVDLATATAGAAMSGLDADDFNTLMLNIGEPPGTMQLLEAYRRGFIDEATLERGILQSRVRDEWIPTIEKLRYAPMSTAAAANAVVRGYLDYNAGAQIAQDNGLEPDQWQYVYHNQGRPPSHEQMMELYYRGLVDINTVTQAIKQSDIKDVYIPEVIELGVKLMPLFESVTLFKDGYISAATFTTQMLDQGYQKSAIDEIVTAVAGGTAGPPKRLTSSEIVSMYEDGALSKTQTVDKLVGIGYKKADATALVDDANTKAAAKRITTLITAERTQLDRYQIDSNTAIDNLVTIGVTEGRAKQLVQDWIVVRPKGQRNLTEAQIMRLLKLKKIHVQEAVTRLQADGYSETDAQLLVSEYE